MDQNRYILAIDQGTTSSKALLVGEDGVISAASRNFPVVAAHPHVGWVEFDPREMLDSVIFAARDAMDMAGATPDEIAAIGLANQGETIIAFDAESGDPICPAISWQDRRTVDIIDRWRADGLESEVHGRTGLRLDPYFSASKFRWVLDNVPRAKELLHTGRLRLGTSDSWLIWRLSGGRRLVTDVSTASRTMLLNLDTLAWDDHLLRATGIPAEVLPDIVPNAGPVCETDKALLGKPMPITGLCVDQQAALFGQQCFRKGQAKATYGTGCFVLANIGGASDARGDGLLTSVGWSIHSEAVYALDGGIYSAGSILNWLRDEMRLYTDHSDLADLASSVNDTGGVYLFPAFSGIAAPHWEPNARAAFLGLTLGSRREHLVRAALESIAFRVRDIVDAMNGPEANIGCLQVDGGLTRNHFLMQLQSDLLGLPLHLGDSPEATAMGVAMMAGIGAGIWGDIGSLPKLAATTKVFEPITGSSRDDLLSRYATWRGLSQELIEWERRNKAS